MPAPTPVVILRARAEARKLMYDAGEFDLETAITPLLNYGIESGLIDQIGERQIYEVINDIFRLEGELAL